MPAGGKTRFVFENIWILFLYFVHLASKQPLL